MQIHISSDGAPIYQQIVDQIRFRIVSGVMRCGEELPTIRGLAESLRVNPNTVARAYRELEHEQLVEKRRTTGTFVSELAPRHTASQRRRMMTPHVDKLLTLSRQLGFELDELITLLQKRDLQFDRPKSDHAEEPS
ncbi:GntR family transcriptional regulator [Novipirellula rosea]|uniref:GntR family transcriptional regulator n=1 Tax=Novipirellula rosea TaxID=1031540 RepID=A0ABP8N7J2_9BACT|tara:strand:+ start:1538 stop:1945 length:408 start_codon:yes stop_codon:yes gene_type:complete